MNPRNAVLALCFVTVAAQAAEVPSVTAEDAAVMRSVLDGQFPSHADPLFIVETTASRDDTDDGVASLRGVNLGQNVTLVTREPRVEDVFRHTKRQDAIVVDFFAPRYPKDHRSAEISCNITVSISGALLTRLWTTTLAREEEKWLVRKQVSTIVQSSKDTRTDEVPLRVGGDVKAPVVLKRVEPVRTPEAVAARISGVVILEAVIDRTGHVTSANVLKPLPFGLDKAAVDAVKQWVFRPGTLNGEPVTVLFNLTVVYRPE